MIPTNKRLISTTFLQEHGCNRTNGPTEVKPFEAIDVKLQHGQIADKDTYPLIKTSLRLLRHTPRIT